MSLSRSTMSAIRFGYGIRPGETPPDGPEALLAQLEAGRKARLRFPVEGIEGRYETIAKIQERVAVARVPDRDQRRENLRPIRREIFHIYGRDQHARVAQAVLSPYGFYERLATFWTDHFAVSARKQRSAYLVTPLYEAEVIRPLMTESFAELLIGAITHPAMLIYLDQTKSFGPNSRRAQRSKRGLNENLGRELLELHTLSVDAGYSQADVRDAALILTGLTVDNKTGRMDFRQQIAEPGPLSFMGQQYAGERRSLDDIKALLTGLANHLKTVRHICRKLAVHFISDNPPPEIVDAMVSAWETSDGRLMDVYAAMLKHPASWENFGEKARQPFDYVVAGLRALDVQESALAMPERHADGDEEMAEAAPPAPMMTEKKDGEDMAAEEAEEEREDKRRKIRLRPPLNPVSVRAIRALGQPVWEPASPAGAEEAFNAWVSTSQLTGRIQWAQLVSSRFLDRHDPKDLLRTVLADAAREDTITVVRQAPNRVTGMALVLASPEFNRR